MTKEGLSYFVIIHKIKENKITILDPAKGEEKKTVDEFFETFDGILLLLVPIFKSLFKEQFSLYYINKGGNGICIIFYL
ncbi:MAG: cysteine peptidase family C39 domain-containing protein [Clostridium paraputrificum]